jgi:hypothetical protein
VQHTEANSLLLAYSLQNAEQSHGIRATGDADADTFAGPQHVMTANGAKDLLNEVAGHEFPVLYRFHGNLGSISGRVRPGPPPAP